MSAKLISYLIGMILSQLSPNVFRIALDKLLDVIEDAVESSASTTDDRIVLPICEMVREAFKVEDNDSEPR